MSPDEYADLEKMVPECLVSMNAVQLVMTAAFPLQFLRVDSLWVHSHCTAWH